MQAEQAAGCLCVQVNRADILFRGLSVRMALATGIANHVQVRSTPKPVLLLDSTVQCKHHLMPVRPSQLLGSAGSRHLASATAWGCPHRAVSA